MRTLRAALLVAFLCAGAAWGADYVVERVAEAAATRGSAGYDATMELKWDSGLDRYWLIWYTGLGAWVANDFDVSTISSYRVIRAIKLRLLREWPNGRWDGFRIGIYGFAGGVPGSLLWGPKFAMPSGSSGWKEFSVAWTLPTGVYRFLAAWEQFYNHPNPGADPFSIDNNPTFMGHSWMYYLGKWELFSNPYTNPYRNVMVRVIVDDTVAVKPTSLGRVKALYY